jgi:cell shape-determining protein MreC
MRFADLQGERMAAELALTNAKDSRIAELESTNTALASQLSSKDAEVSCQAAVIITPVLA